MPAVRATTTVTVNAVSGAVLFIRSCSSLNQGLLDPTEGVAVTTPPVPPPVTVSETVVERVVDPDTAVMVTVAAPTVAVLDAVNVTVDELPVVDAGLNEAVTPLGKPEALSATDPGKLVRLIETVAVPLAPRATDSGPDVPTVKSLATVPVTVSATVDVRDTEPEVAVIVTLNVPSVAELEALNVAVTELPVVAAEGLNATATPAGNPPAVIATAPVKLVRLIVSGVAALALLATDSVTDAGDSVKSGVGFACVVPFTVAAVDCLPDASSARTAYEYAVFAVRPVSVNVSALVVATTVEPRVT
jgi:hypothetical protein